MVCRNVDMLRRINDGILQNLILGFPVALLHRYTLYGKDPIRQHIFFITCGLSIGYWNYGNSSEHDK